VRSPANVAEVLPVSKFDLTIVSCIAVRIPNESNIILDTGEHSLASLKRHLSPSEYHEFFSKLRLIYISHPHADHHLGLISIVKQYIQIQNTLPQSQRMPLFLIAPHRLFSSLYEYNQVEDLGIEGYIVPFASNTLIPRLLADAYAPPDLGLFQGFLSHMNLRSVETCFVPHCSQAYGVAITHKSGWKIVYSGDCRPSGDLVEIGQDATVLIHEATLAESQRPEAVDKMHSTTGEAITIGNRMRAKHILLTHFSQKWHTVPKFVLEWSEHKNEKEKYGNVGIAFDRMRVKIGEMWKLPLLYPAFAAMYGSPKTKRYVAHTKGVNQVDGGNGDETEEEEPIAKRRRMQESEQKEAIAIGQ
jgi:ribonuclease Z